MNEQNQNSVQNTANESQPNNQKHEEKICPNCLRIFECKVGSIQLCQCTKVSLTKDETEYLATQYNDCLCFQCMEKLAFEYKTNKSYKSINWNF
ncbi:cysteine-rich CWC family protein [Leptospira sp. WS39.C2]